MQDLFAVSLCFIFSFVLHVVAHRIISRISMAAYLVGAVILGILVHTGFITLPIDAFVLYICLSGLTLLLYTAVSLGTELPSSTILESFRQHKRQTGKQLIGLFTDKGLIANRVDDLVSSGMVVSRGGKLQLTGRGKIVRKAIRIYRNIFYRKEAE